MVLFFAVLVVSVVRNREWYLLAGALGLFLHFVTEAFLYAPMFAMTLGTLYGVSCIYSRAPAHARRPAAAFVGERRYSLTAQ
jgi:hypothetical protein